RSTEIASCRALLLGLSEKNESLQEPAPLENPQCQQERRERNDCSRAGTGRPQKEIEPQRTTERQAGPRHRSPERQIDNLAADGSIGEDQLHQAARQDRASR